MTRRATAAEPRRRDAGTMPAPRSSALARWFARFARVRLVVLDGESMGTTWSVKIAMRRAVSVDALRTVIDAELARVIAQMSTWTPDSDLGRYNRAAAGSRCALPDGFYAVLSCALDVARDSGGAFDPTVGPLVNLWGFGPDGRRLAPPDAAAVEAARARCGWQRLELDHATQRLLQPGGLALDLCSIAKGYAVDEIAACLDRHGCTDYLVEVGGELRARGRRPDGAAWRVALERPDAGAADTVVALGDVAIATSGDYYHYFDRDDRRYSHTIDPRTGEPVAHGLASVTVLHAQAMRADAYATALTVLGPDDGMAYAQRRGIAARFVTRRAGGCVTADTPAFAAALHA